MQLARKHVNNKIYTATTTSKTSRSNEEMYCFQIINNNNVLFTYALTKFLRKLISRASKVFTAVGTFNVSFRVSRVQGTKFCDLLTDSVCIPVNCF